jgi:hypothetical protein
MMKTEKVKMKVVTSWNKQPLVKGDVIEVSKFLAERWEMQGICEILKPTKKITKSKAIVNSKNAMEFAKNKK